MCYEKSLQKMIVVTLVTLFLAGCGGSITTPPTATIQPTATPEAPSISGTLIGPNGPIEGNISLTFYPDEECAKLADSETLTDKEKQELNSCSSELPPITSNEHGEYKFTNLSPGWYLFGFSYSMNEKPNIKPTYDSRQGIVLVFFETDDEPKIYIGSAVRPGTFYFSGKEDVVIDFDYNKDE